MFNPLFVNPAYAGSREAISTSFVARNQWVGFQGAPNTQTLSIHAPLAQKKIGLGIGVVRDKIGPSTNTGMHANFAYRIRMGRGKLAFGLRSALYNFAFDWSQINFKDLSVQQLPNSYWMPSFDFALRYHDHQKFIGLTLAHLNQPSVQSNQVIDSLNNPLQLQSYASLVWGYAFELSDQVIFKPSFLLNQSIRAGRVFDLNASVLLNHKLWLGLSYRSSKVMVFMVQYDLSDQISVGYSYDWVLSGLRNQQSGSHELFLRYEFEIKKSAMSSPRYF